MKLPKIIIRWLLGVHARAQLYPYFDLNGYMLRSWVLGFSNEKRNAQRLIVAPRRGWLYQRLTDLVAIRAHTILRSDSDRHLHNHPCASLSIVLEGGYWEVGMPSATALRYPDAYEAVLNALEGFVRLRDCPDYVGSFNIRWRGPGSVVARRADEFHRIVVPHGTICKSIFVMGPKTQDWGFEVDGSFVPWREYLGA